MYDLQGVVSRQLIAAAMMVNLTLAFGGCAAFMRPEKWSSSSPRISVMTRNAQKEGSTDKIVAVGSGSDAFLHDFFFSSECNDVNLPPSLSTIYRSFAQLESGSDIRGKFVDHPRRGNIAAVAKAIRNENHPALTPFAAHCFGYAFASMLKKNQKGVNDQELVICIGRDPRTHGTSLADSFSRGAESVTGVRVVYTGLATTPSMFDFCR